MNKLRPFKHEDKQQLMAEEAENDDPTPLSSQSGAVSSSREPGDHGGSPSPSHHELADAASWPDDVRHLQWQREAGERVSTDEPDPDPWRRSATPLASPTPTSLHSQPALHPTEPATSPGSSQQSRVQDLSLHSEPRSSVLPSSFELPSSGPSSSEQLCSLQSSLAQPSAVQSLSVQTPSELSSSEQVSGVPTSSEESSCVQSSSVQPRSVEKSSELSSSEQPSSVPSSSDCKRAPRQAPDFGVSSGSPFVQKVAAWSATKSRPKQSTQPLAPASNSYPVSPVSGHDAESHHRVNQPHSTSDSPFPTNYPLPADNSASPAFFPSTESLSPPESPTSDSALLLPRKKSRKTNPSYQTFPGTMESNGKASDDWSPYTSKTDMVPDEPPPKPKENRTFVYVLASFATIGGLLFGYDTGIVSGSMLLIAPFFDLDTVWQEVIVSGTVGAAAVFALVAGFFCDWLGRKRSIMLASFIFAVGAVVMGAAPNKEVLLGGRIIVGAGIGFASMIVPVYVAEAAPADIRGRLVTLNQLFITIGIVLSSIIAGAFSTMRDTGWRYMLGLAGVPAVIQLVGFIYLPESPRWLVMKGREEEARTVLQRIRGHEQVEEELQEIKDAEASKETGFVLGKILTTPHVRKALLIGSGLQLFQQLCGINTVIYYSATILKNAGFPPKLAIWLVCVPFAVNFLATFLGLWLVERLGRKLLLIISFIGITVALVVLGLGFLLSSQHSPAVNPDMPITFYNGTYGFFNGTHGDFNISDACYQKYSVCEDCILNDKCGYCYDDSQSERATCLRVDEGDHGRNKDLYALYGRCAQGYNVSELAGVRQDPVWAYGYCPTDYTWMAVLGLALFVLSFAPGLGPMPWTINSEIYPMWARGTACSIATMVNWVFNLIVSFSFLSMLEAITKYGTFFLFCGVCVLGLLFTITFVPETKNKSLEEVEELFMTPERREQSRRQRTSRDNAKSFTVPDPHPDPSPADTRF